MRSRTLVLALAALALFSRAAAAQDDEYYDDDYGYSLPRSYLGGEFAVARP